MSLDRSPSRFLIGLVRALGKPFSTETLLGRTQSSEHPSGPLSEAEFQRRLPVWIALADFFLDTYSHVFYIHTARTWWESGFSRDDLQSMLRDDVAPRFFSNLTVVAGVWDGFTDEQVELQMRRQMRRPKRIDWIYRGDMLGYLDKVWVELLPYLDAAEQGLELSTFVPDKPSSAEQR